MHHHVAGHLLERVCGKAPRVRVGLTVLCEHFERKIEQRHAVLERVRVVGVAIRAVRLAVRLRKQVPYLRDLVP